MKPLADLATRTTDLPTRPVRVTGRVLGLMPVGRRVAVVFDESAAWEYAAVPDQQEEEK